MDQSHENGHQSPAVEFRVAVLVDSEIVRHGLAAMLSSLAIVGEVHIWDPASQDSAIPSSRRWDILILGFSDIEIAVAHKYAEETWRQGGKILLLLQREQEDELDMVAAFPSNGFLVQDQLTSASLAATITSMANGATPMPGMLANRLLSRVRAGSLETPPMGTNLTPREREVLKLLVEGLSNKEIARRLRISQHGVKRLVSNVLAKLSCPNRTLAATVAITEGILVNNGDHRSP